MTRFKASRVIERKLCHAVVSFFIAPSHWRRNIGQGFTTWLAACFVAFFATFSMAATGPGEDRNGRRISPIEPRNIVFNHLTLKDGLSQATVTAIEQDQQGFIWFGTQEGLNRYDGNQIEIFEHDSRNPSALSHDWISSLLSADDGVMWIGTVGGGLNRFDPVTRQFSQYRHDPDNQHSLSGDRIRSIYRDRQGVLWVGTEKQGLNRFDAALGQFIRYQHDPDNADSLSDNGVYSIIEDAQGNLWVGTRKGGLDRLDRDSGVFTHFRHDPADNTTLSNDSVSTLFQDSAGTLWVGTYAGGLNRYRPDTQSFSRFRHNPDDMCSLSSDVVLDIHQDKAGSLWVATDNGLNEWRPQNGGFAHHHSSVSDPDSLTNNRITAIFQDRGGVLWVGTYNGINKWNYVSESFNYYRSSGSDFKLSNNVVTAVAQGQNNQLWVGTYGGGLNRLDFISGKTTYYQKNSNNSEGLSDNRIMAVYPDNQQSVWLGTRSGGLNRLDLRSGRIEHFRFEPTDPASLSSDAVTSIQGDRDGTLWIGTLGGGLNRWDPQTGEFTRYRHDPKDDSSLGSDLIWSIYRDRSGVLWVGTDNGGLNRFDPKTGGFVRYLHDPGNPHSLGSNSISALHEGRDGSLWIGTFGGGLNRWSAQDRYAGRALFSRYRKGDGLLSYDVMAILEDNWGHLWLSSNRGLSRLDPDNGAMRHFSRSNGLKDDDFNFSSRAIGDDGRLYMGSSAGLVSFLPGDIYTNHHRPPVALNAYTRHGLLQSTHSQLPQRQPVELDSQDELIVFEYAGLDFAAPEKNLYRYRLHGFDKAWSAPVRFQRTTYTNLPTGEYIFEIVAANNDGVWSSQPARFKFEVVPPPWLSPLAYGVYLAVIISLVLWYLRSQSSKLLQETRQRIELEAQVRSRTHELAERNEQLQLLNQTLKDISVTDVLTGLKNRRFIHEYMKTEAAGVGRRVHALNHSRSSNGPLDIVPSISFLMIDLDGFKIINDRFGHEAGDNVLVQVSDILQHCCRSNDIISRWGGDEFLILCRHSTPHAAEKLAERICNTLYKHQFAIGNGNVASLSASIGFAQYPFSPRQPDVIDWESVTVIADRAAYLAKKNGRNAWAGIYGHPHISRQECLDIHTQLQSLLANGRVSVKTSISKPLVFDKAVEPTS